MKKKVWCREKRVQGLVNSFVLVIPFKVNFLVCFQEKVAFESEFILLGRDKCKTMEKGKHIQASREPPSRSFFKRGHSREKGKDQKSSRKVPSRSVSDRIRKRVCSDGYNDLSAHLFSKRCVISIWIFVVTLLVSWFFWNSIDIDLLNVDETENKVTCKYILSSVVFIDILRSHIS